METDIKLKTWWNAQEFQNWGKEIKVGEKTEDWIYFPDDSIRKTKCYVAEVSHNLKDHKEKTMLPQKKWIVKDRNSDSRGLGDSVG